MLRIQTCCLEYYAVKVVMMKSDLHAHFAIGGHLYLRVASFLVYTNLKKKHLKFNGEVYWYLAFK